MKKKIYGFVLLSATLLLVSACSSDNTLSIGTGQSSSEGTAISSKALTPNLDIDTKNLKISRNSEEESYSVVDNIQNYVGTYKGYVEVYNGLVEIQTAIFEDGTFQQIRIPLPKTSNLTIEYVNESGVVKEVDPTTTVNGSNYKYVDGVTFLRGVLIEQFDNVYLVPSEKPVYLRSIWDQTGNLNYTNGLLSESLVWFRKPISSEEDWADFYESVKLSLNWSDIITISNFEPFSYFKDGEYYEKEQNDISASPLQKSDEVADIVKYSLNEILNREAVSSHISSLNDLFQTTTLLDVEIESIPQGTTIYDSETGEKYEVIYGFKYDGQYNEKEFIAYTGDVFRIYIGTEENGKYIGKLR
ncbi:hypothetical protein [Streptococcus suis]|uniref:hypothetical protein n=1 Tax=Streptococcus suis TaxID=1307 RepID=UPI0004192A5C|nr:hypothetical protein [Streptococcus suis]MBM7283327.1 hypothetical protein [Streptococcus suis]MCL4880859.1 hypothetical protein [Streptococcus suis]MCO8237473.1 hypothetical protein [Streptococcus suis]HEM3531897.1 hypothetical protein [Streptococcus suis]